MPAASSVGLPHPRVHATCNHYVEWPMQRSAEAFFAFHYRSEVKDTNAAAEKKYIMMIRFSAGCVKKKTQMDMFKIHANRGGYFPLIALR